MARTTFLYDPTFLQHDTGPSHPECATRLVALTDLLERSGTLSKTIQLPPRAATPGDLYRVHSSVHVENVSSLSLQGSLVAASADTVASPHTYHAALLAAGAGQTAVDQLLAGAADNAFCAVRPPGHHAERETVMGFCFFNNVAVAVRHAQECHGLGRVAIVDWDVHHGNGTQHAFESDPTVFFFSVHQYPHYPGTGAARERGMGAGSGTTLNVPTAAGAGDVEYARIFSEQLRPALAGFEPELIMLSAGFDAHQADPLGDMCLSEEGFAMLTRSLLEMAEDLCDGRLISMLEGGYAIDPTAEAIRRHIEELAAW